MIYNNGKKIAHKYEVICTGSYATNNAAEYAAVASALKYLLYRGYGENEIKIYSDSNLAIQQLLGNYRVKSNYMMRWYKICKLFESKLSNISYYWIPRENNREADFLSKKAFKERNITTEVRASNG